MVYQLIPMLRQLDHTHGQYLVGYIFHFIIEENTYQYDDMKCPVHSSYVFMVYKVVSRQMVSFVVQIVKPLKTYLQFYFIIILLMVHKLVVSLLILWLF